MEIKRNKNCKSIVAQVVFWAYSSPYRIKETHSWQCYVTCNIVMWEKVSPWIKRGERGGYSTDTWVGRCGPGAQTLILFTTQISDFPISLRQNSDFSDTVYHTLVYHYPIGCTPPLSHIREYPPPPPPPPPFLRHLENFSTGRESLFY